MPTPEDVKKFGSAQRWHAARNAISNVRNDAPWRVKSNFNVIRSPPACLCVAFIARQLIALVRGVSWRDEQVPLSLTHSTATDGDGGHSARLEFGGVAGSDFAALSAPARAILRCTPWVPSRPLAFSAVIDDLLSQPSSAASLPTATTMATRTRWPTAKN